jgi:hypothetical protein
MKTVERTLSDVWGIPRAEESQICVQGNLEIDHKKEGCVPRMCHLHFSHLEFLKENAHSEFIVAVGLVKGSKRTIRSPPISFTRRIHALNLTFSFQYLHFLKVDDSSNNNSNGIRYSKLLSDSIFFNRVLMKRILFELCCKKE